MAVEFPNLPSNPAPPPLPERGPTWKESELYAPTRVVKPEVVPDELCPVMTSTPNRLARYKDYLYDGQDKKGRAGYMMPLFVIRKVNEVVYGGVNRADLAIVNSRGGYGLNEVFEEEFTEQQVKEEYLKRTAHQIRGILFNSLKSQDSSGFKNVVAYMQEKEEYSMEDISAAIDQEVAWSLSDYLKDRPDAWRTETEDIQARVARFTELRALAGPLPEVHAEKTDRWKLGDDAYMPKQLIKPVVQDADLKEISDRTFIAKSHQALYALHGDLFYAKSGKRESAALPTFIIAALDEKYREAHNGQDKRGSYDIEEVFNYLSPEGLRYMYLARTPHRLRGATFIFLSEGKPALDSFVNVMTSMRKEDGISAEEMRRAFDQEVAWSLTDYLTAHPDAWLTDMDDIRARIQRFKELYALIPD
jgi:hypothetical protein